jgi:hypothetical protein
VGLPGCNAAAADKTGGEAGSGRAFSSRTGRSTRRHAARLTISTFDIVKTVLKFAPRPCALRDERAATMGAPHRGITARHEARVGTDDAPVGEHLRPVRAISRSLRPKIMVISDVRGFGVYPPNRFATTNRPLASWWGKVGGKQCPFAR